MKTTEANIKNGIGLSDTNSRRRIKDVKKPERPEKIRTNIFIERDMWEDTKALAYTLNYTSANAFVCDLLEREIKKHRNK